MQAKLFSFHVVKSWRIGLFNIIEIFVLMQMCFPRHGVAFTIGSLKKKINYKLLLFTNFLFFIFTAIIFINYIVKNRLIIFIASFLFTIITSSIFIKLLFVIRKSRD